MINSEGLPAQVACRVLQVSESGFYEWRRRPPSARSIRHVWLTDMIRQVHTASRGTYGANRVHAELTMGYGVGVGHNAVEMLMRRAGLAGLPGSRRRRRPAVIGVTAADLVDRNFIRTEPDQLWLTDITEHRTREGKVYCAVVLDVLSRRVVGWSIDSSPTSSLVTSALGYGYRESTTHQWDCDPFRSGRPVHLLGVYPPGPPVGLGPLYGVDRRLLR
ncbi:MAG: IS3 family transposase [Actinobacteria bacterium]|nr:IS3 family transposase [Actinomycetota bacterium]